MLKINVHYVFPCLKVVARLTILSFNPLALGSKSLLIPGLQLTAELDVAVAPGAGHVREAPRSIRLVARRRHLSRCRRKRVRLAAVVGGICPRASLMRPVGGPLEAVPAQTGTTLARHVLAAEVVAPVHRVLAFCPTNKKRDDSAYGWPGLGIVRFESFTDV